MNLHKKIMLMLGVTTLAFQTGKATVVFDKIKYEINTAFKALFDPVPATFTLLRFGKDAHVETKLNNFHKAMRDASLFIKNNNKGLMLGASRTLTQANELLAIQTDKLIHYLNDMRKRLAKTNTLAGKECDTATRATQDFINLGSIQDTIKCEKDILCPKINNYKSAAQKGAYELLLDALQVIYDAAAIVRYQLKLSGWLKYEKNTFF